MRRCWSVLTATLLFGAGLAVVAVPAASAASAVTLSETAPSSVLYGTPATVTLTAANTTAAPAFNASFEDVLPLGVSYVAGSSSVTGNGSPYPIGDPTVIANAPSTGLTTLLWPNVADIQPSSQQVLTFQLQGQTDAGANFGPNPVLPNAAYSDSASVYTNSNPRYVPQFDPTTGVAIAGATSYTDSATASGTTAIRPLSIQKSEPSPESELPRGVHQHQTTYTVIVQNNAVHATNAVTVTDWLPAGLEFLQCGGIDNTTNASGTNPGSTTEYPGSGSLAVGAPLSSAVCPTPTSVATVANPVTPSGTLSGVYTQVTWTVPNLAAGANDTIQYKAAIPLRQNTLVFSGATPTPASAGQAANLDNNNGPETTDTQSLTNVVGATGAYQGALASGVNPVSASATATVEAIDLALQKTASSSVLVGGKYVQYTLHYQTSEYRYSTGATLTDHLPTGQCPISATANYATDSASAECAAVTGKDPSTPYGPSSPPTEQSDGSFSITWDLATLAPNTDTTITFWALDRTFYQGTTGNGLGPTTPTLVGDGSTNTASLTATVNGTCFSGTASASTPDPICSAPSHTVIYSGEATPATATNGSHVSQQAAEPVITKSVSQAVAPGGTLSCPSATYLTPASTGYPPTYESGDTICFQLEVDFPAGLYAHNANVTDFLPPNASFVSSVPVTGNTVTIASTTDQGTTPDSVTFALGTPQGSNPGLYVSPNQKFLVDVAIVATQPPVQGNSFTLTSNLMKFTALNSAGQGISLRSSASYNLSQPLLSLTKTVTQVNGAAPGVSVKAGDVVTYQVAVKNTGLIPATSTTIWDNLPSQITSCGASVTLISNSGICATSTQIQWTGLNVPAATSGGPGVVNLTYKMAVPAAVSSKETLTNNAGVVTYSGQLPNNGGASGASYTPANNINPSAPTSNAPAANASASVVTAAPTLSKTATGTINGSGKATIGEPVAFTLTSTIPAGTTLYGATLTDPLPAALPTALLYSTTPAAVTGTVKVGSGAATALTASGFSFTTANNTITLQFPTTFATTTTQADTITVTFYATVTNVAANLKSVLIPNTATLAWNNSVGLAATPVSASASTKVVEPLVSVVKTDGLSGGPYTPGATVTYSVTVTNATGSSVSAANDVVVTDSLPATETAVTCGSPPANWTCSYTATPSTLTWTLNTSNALAIGASAVFSYTAVLPNPVIGASKFVNTVAVTATSLDTATYPGARTTGVGYSATANDTVTVAGATIAKVANPLSVTNGVDTMYTATITVPPGLNLPNFTAVDTLPDGMIFDGYGGSSTCVDTSPSAGGVCGADVVTQSVGTPVKSGSTGRTGLAWYIGNLSAETGTRTITVNYRAYPAKFYTTGGGTIPVSAPIVLNNAIKTYWGSASASAPTTIPSPTCGTAPYQFCSNQATGPVTVTAPILSLAKTASTAAPTPGVPFTYTLTMTNTGTATAYDPIVTDTLPASLDRSFSSVGSPSQGAATYVAATGVLTWDLTGTTLIPGATATLQVTTQLAPSATLTPATITNSAAFPAYYGVAATTATPSPARYETYGPVSASVGVTPAFPTPVVTKSMPNGPGATVATPFTWNLVVTNSSVAPAAATTVTDSLPPFWTYTPTSAGGANTTTITLANATTLSGAAGDPSVATNAATHVETLTWSGLGNVAASQSITISYTATPGPGVSRSNLNQAAAAVQDGSGATGNANGPYQSAPATATAIIQTADLSMVKTIGGAGTLTAGGAANVYDMAVTNHGPDAAATPVVVTDTAPTGTSFTGGSGGSGVTTWSCVVAAAGASITCTLSAGLASGASAPALVVAVAIPSGATGSLTNTAVVSSPTNDSNLVNNTSSVTASIAVTAHLAVTKTHSGSFTAGSNGTYQLAVTDNGPSDSPAPGPITLTDTLPTGEGFVSAVGTGWTCSPAGAPVTVTCTLSGGLAADATSGIVLTVSVPSNQAAGSITNSAGVTGPDSPPATVSDPTTIVASADLSIDKTHDVADTFVPGTTVTYRLAVADAGPSDAAAPTVVDTLPSYETPISVSGTGWTCGSALQVVTCNATGPLAANTSAAAITLMVRLAGTLPASVVNTATVSSGTSDPASGNNTSTDTSSGGATSADLGIAKTHSGDFTAGQQGTYTLVVSNLGPSDAAGPVTVTDTLPGGETFASGTGSGWTCSATDPSTVICTLAAGLVAGPVTASISLTVNLAGDLTQGADVVNTAAVTSPTPDPQLLNNTAHDSTTIVTSADLSIVKTDHGPFIPGTDGTYTLTVNNAGPSAAAGPVSVSDPLPTGETFVSATGSGWTCQASGQDVSCALSAGLAVGDPTVITLRVEVDGSHIGSITNTATVSSVTPDPTPLNNSSTDVADTTPQAHLTVSKTHVGSFVAGAPGSYQITATNNGPSDNVGPVIVTDPLPAGESFVSATGTGWTCLSAGTPEVVTCTHSGGLVALATTAPITLTATVAPDVAPGTLTNVATVNSPSTPDPSPGGTSSDPATVITSADLSIVKSHTGTAAAGSNLTYTLAVANAGPSDAAGPVTVSDTLPTGETYVSAAGTGWTCAGSGTPTVVTCSLPGLAVSDSPAAAITLVVAVGPAAYPSVTNTATVTSPTPDPDTTNNTSSDPATIPPYVDLSIVKSHLDTAVAGAELTYDLAVTNVGSLADPGPVTVTDPLPTGETFVSAAADGWTCGASGNTVTCTLNGPLAVDADYTITLVVALGAAALPSVANTATISGLGNDPFPANNTSTDTAAVVPGADLSILKSHTGSAIVGSDLAYSLTVSNVGPSDAAGPVTVTDPLPTGETFVSAAGTGWTCSGAGTPTVVTCTLAAGLAVIDSPAPTITLVVAVGVAAYPSVTNTATITSPTADPDMTNNTSSDEADVSPLVDLSIVKTHLGNAVAGADLTYDLAVTNAGPQADPGPVTVTDPLPVGETFVSASSPGWTCGALGGTVTCTLPGPFAVSANSTIALVVALGAAAVPSVTNTATIAGTGTDAIPANNTSSDTASVTPSANLSIAKTHTGSAPVGSDFSYSLLVANAGPSDAAGPVTVTDPLPTGETFVSAGGTGWTCVGAGTPTVVTCTLAAGLAVTDSPAPTITLMVAVGLAAYPSVTNTATVTSPTADPDMSNNTSSDPTTISAYVDLSIVKSHVDTAVAGGDLTYDLAVSNVGSLGDPGPVTVTDPLPIGETFVSAAASGWTCGAVAGTVTCVLPGPLAVGDDYFITLVVALGAAAAPSVTNTATVAGTGVDPVLANNISSDTATVAPSADLSILKSHTGSAVVGSDLSYSLLVSNAGPSDAAGPVTVTDPLPTGETFVSAAGTGWTCSGAGTPTVVTCTLAAGLAVIDSPAPTITLMVAVGLAAYPSVTNTATITSPTADPDMTNNTSSDEADVSPLVDLSIVKTHLGNAVAGADLTYDLAVTNAGPQADPGPVTVTDPLPVGETFVSASSPGWTCGALGGTVTCTLPGPFAVSANSTIALVVALGAAAVPSVTNTATIAGTGTDSVSANNTSTDTADVAPRADMSIVKTHTGDPVVGSDLSYTLAVSNAGPSDAAGPVTVTDPLPVGETFVSAAGTGWTCASAGTPEVVTCNLADGLAVSDSPAPVITLVVAVGLAAYPSVTNTATVTSPTPDPDTTNNTSSDPATVSPYVDLSIVKTHLGNAVAGADLTYDLAVSNVGSLDDPGPVTVTDPLPTGETFVSAAASGWTCGAVAGTVTCVLPGPLGVGASYTVTLVVTLGAAAVPSVTNIATVAGTGIDPVPANNTSSDTATVAPSADLSILKTHSGSAVVGSDLSYSLTVSNVGPSDAAGPLTVTDPLPIGETFVSAVGTGWTCLGAGTPTVVTCTLAAGLAVIDSPAPPISLVVAVGVAAYPSVTNTATVTSPTADPDMSNNTSSDEAEVSPLVDLSIVKTHLGNAVAGANLTYDLAVTNAGPQADPGPVTVTDPLPVGETFVSAVADGWTCGALENTMTCTLPGPFAVSANSTIALVVALGAAAVPSVTNTATITGAGTDSVPANNTSTDTADVAPRADLSIVKTHTGTADVGSDLSYTLVVSNGGPSDAAGPVTVTDPLPVGETFVSAAGTGWTCASAGTPEVVTCDLADGLAVSDSPAPVITLMVAVGLAAYPSVTNTATVASPTPDPDTTNNTSSDPTTVSPYVDLSIVKSHVDTAVAGGDLTYDLAVSNVGSLGDPGPVTVTDPLPIGETFVSAAASGWTCGAVAGTVTCVLPGPLAVGDDYFITLVVALGAAAAPSVTNTATVAGTGVDPVLANNISSDTATVAPSADLSILKTHTGSAVVGSDLSYSLLVSNAGPSDAAGPVTVTDPLPTGETFVSAAGTGWTCLGAGTPTVVTCTLAAGLAVINSPAPPISLVVAVGLAAYPSVTNTATVNSPTADPKVINDTASDPTNVAPSADLSIVKTHLGDAVAGANLTYDLAVTNAGPQADPGPLTVSDPLPVGETFVSAAGDGWTCGAVENTMTCTLPGPFAVSANSTIALVVALGAAAVPSVTNTATIAGTGTDPVPANNTSTDTADVAPRADLAIVKTHIGDAVVGSDLSYSLAVSNAGPSDAAGPVTVTDPLPTGETFVSAGGTGWTCPTVGTPTVVSCTLSAGLAVSGSPAPAITLTVDVGPAAYPSVTNTATVSSPTPDPATTNNTSSDPATVSPYVDLSIVKTHLGNAVAGAELTYDLAVSNVGSQVDPGPVTVTDPLPTGETFVSASADGWTCGAVVGTVTCVLPGPLGVDASDTITVVVALGAAAVPSVTNTATVAGTGIDPVPANNTSSDVAPVVPGADLSIVKTHLGDAVAGANLTYDLAVTNAGPQADPGPLTVSDPLPVGETFVSAAGDGWTCGAVENTMTCTLPGPFAVSANSTIALVVALGAAAVPSVTNTATIAGTGTDPVPANNTSTDTADVAPRADLSIVKTHTGTAEVGSDLSYTLAVSNAGPSDAAGPVTVTDHLPAGETFVSATGTGWKCSDGGTPTVVTCTLAAGLAVSKSPAPAITLIVALGPAAYPKVTNTAIVSSPTADPDTTNNTSSDPTIVAPYIDLSIVKSHLGTAVAGANLTYDLAVRNVGSLADPGPVTVTDPLPNGETFVSATATGWTCANTSQPALVTCTLPGPFAAGAKATITLVVALGAAAIPSVTNTATIAGTGADPVPGNNTSADIAAVVPGSLLVLTKTLNGTTLVTGSPAFYNVTVANRGPSPATKVTITDTLPAGLQGLTADGFGWSCGVTTAAVTCTATQPMADGATSTFTVVAMVTATAGTVVNAVSAGAQSSLIGGVPTAHTAAMAVVAAVPAVTPSAMSPTPVAPASPVALASPTRLAATGIDLREWISAALTFLIVGLALVGVTRRPWRSSRP